jgi:hypothetical protein
VTDTEDIALQKAELARVLASAEFQASPQARRFLEYAAQRVFGGGGAIDQADIARDVLDRGSDFDPTTDASVRKLAMQVRQRLERYYAGPGMADPVAITLPLRSYAPHFLMRDAEPAAAPAATASRGRSRRWPWAIAGLAAVAAAGLLWFMRAPAAAAPDSHIRILTQRGDITSPKADPHAGTLRLFGELGAAEDVIVRLTFRPDRERQHAGLIVWEGPRRFVTLERRFTSHNYIAFGYEYESYLDGHPITQIDDPDAQSGAPLWLRIRRDGNTYTAFTSVDGRAWRPVGDPLELPKPLVHPRAGIFAVNGRRDSPSIPADFEFLGTGLILPHASAEGPWNFQSDCRQGPEIFLGESAAAPADPCSATWVRAVPEGEWSITARLDMLANPTLVAGLIVQLETARVRLLRYPSDGPKISLIHDGVTLESAPDYPGSPPVYLRLTHARGRIEGAASVDGRSYRVVGSGVSLNGLGKPKAAGVVATRRTGSAEGPAPPLRVLFVTLGR